MSKTAEDASRPATTARRPFARTRRFILGGMIGFFALSAVNPVQAKTGALTAATQFVTIDGNKLAYRSIGSGSPILMPNRLRGTIDTWDPAFIDALAKRHRVILFDYPGVGYSDGTLPPDMTDVSDIVAKFATRIGLGKFDVVAWSWGGAMSQVFLVRHADRVRRAVLIGTSPPGKNAAAMQPSWFALAIKPVNDLADEQILFFEPKSQASMTAARLSHDRIYARPGVVDHIPSTMPEFERFFGAVQKYQADKEGIREALMRSSIPMLILCGDNDPSTPAENWYPLVGKIPNAQLIVLPQAGHAPQHQYPLLAATYITEFLRSAEH